MLNIGKLGAGAAEYYVGEVATSAEDYYTGQGEAQGRWVGSLAAELGLDGRGRARGLPAGADGPAPAHRRATSSIAQGSATHAGDARIARPEQEANCPDAGRHRCARLRTSACPGSTCADCSAEGDRISRRGSPRPRAASEATEPSAYLLGRKADGDGPGSDSWMISRDRARTVRGARATRPRPDPATT